MAKKNGQSVSARGAHIGLSIALGAGFGVAFDNIPIGAVVGLLIGVINAAWHRSRPD